MNKENNKELLEDAICMDFFDLSFYVVADFEDKMKVLCQIVLVEPKTNDK